MVQGPNWPCGGECVQAGCEEEGQIDAAVTDDGAGEGDEEANEEHAGEGEDKAENGKGERGGRRMGAGRDSRGPGVGRMSADGLNERKEDDDPGDQQLDGKSEIDGLSPGAGERFEEAVECRGGEGPKEAGPGAFEGGKGESGMALQIVEFFLPAGEGLRDVKS